MIYTHSEQTLKKYSKADVFSAAYVIAKDKNKQLSAKKEEYTSTEKEYTLPQLNEKVKIILFNSFYG